MKTLNPYQRPLDCLHPNTSEYELLLDFILFLPFVVMKNNLLLMNMILKWHSGCITSYSCHVVFGQRRVEELFSDEWQYIRGKWRLSDSSECIHKIVFEATKNNLCVCLQSRKITVMRALSAAPPASLQFADYSLFG